jgi:hypothetical protein
LIADAAAGGAVAFRLAPGQAHELPHAVPPLERLPDVPGWVVADRDLGSHALREHVWARLKDWRAVATRYEKTAASFLDVLCLATTADWLRARGA